LINEIKGNHFEFRNTLLRDSIGLRI